MEKCIASDDRYIAAATAVYDFSLSTRNRTARIATGNSQIHSHHGAAQDGLEFVVRHLYGGALTRHGTGPPTSGDTHESPMTMLPPRLAQWSGRSCIRSRFHESDLCIAVDWAKLTASAGFISKGSIEQWQAFDATVPNNQTGICRIDSV